MPKTVFFVKSFLVFAILFTVTMTGGCTDRRQPKGETGTVSGTVKYKGQPVTVGFIMFQDQVTKKGGSAPLGADGTYTISVPIEVGEYNVAFPPPNPPAPLEEKEPEVSPIPQKYHIPEQATIKFTVVKGENTADFDLE